MADHIYIYSGESVRVKFIAKRQIIFDILDCFGTDIIMNEKWWRSICHRKCQPTNYFLLGYAVQWECRNTGTRWIARQNKKTANELANKYSIGIPWWQASNKILPVIISFTCLCSINVSSFNVNEYKRNKKCNKLWILYQRYWKRRIRLPHYRQGIAGFNLPSGKLKRGKLVND